MVALYAEGVGRNTSRMLPDCPPSNVALYAEGVGRNYTREEAEAALESRPLRGGRG